MSFASKITRLRGATLIHSAPDIPQCFWNHNVGRELKLLAQHCTLTPLPAFAKELPVMGAGFHYTPERPTMFVHGYKLEVSETYLTLSLIGRCEENQELLNYQLSTYWIQAATSSPQKGTQLLMGLFDLIPFLYDWPIQFQVQIQLIKLIHAVGNRIDNFELWLMDDGFYARAGKGRDGIYGCRFKDDEALQAA